MALRTALLAGLLLIFSLPGPLRAQVDAEGDCDVPDHDGFTQQTQSNGSRIFNFRFPTIRCSGGTWINADSARIFESNNYSQLFGHVVFRDGETRLTADEARYFTQLRRLRAWGNVILTDQTEGSEFRGDTMVLVRAGPGQEVDELTVTGSRPHATLYPSRQPPEPAPEAAAQDTLAAAGDSLGAGGVQVDSTGAVATPGDSTVAEAPQDVAEVGEGEEEERVPYEIDARRFFLRGTGFFIATGTVLVQRDSLDAAADSLEYDESQGSLFLARNASLRTSSYDLLAETIRLDIPQDEIRHVDARKWAVLEGEDLRLLAPSIALFLTQGRMERLVAMMDSAAAAADSVAEDPEAEEEPPLLRASVEQALLELGLEAFPPRPFALAEDFQLVADSIEVLAPEEVLSRVQAAGKARGVSFARDSLNRADTPGFMLHDWLEGDTIVATFLPPEDQPVETPSDTAGRTFRLERLVAKVGARSLYRLTASDSTVTEEEGRLAVHYVLGQEITITMNQGDVERMEVMGSTVGIHGEPVVRSRRGDTLSDTIQGGTLPDTAGGVIPPDTAGGVIPPDTAHGLTPPDKAGREEGGGGDRRPPEPAREGNPWRGEGVARTRGGRRSP